MLSGTRAFEGDDVSITLASVLKDDIDWKVLPAELPPSIVRLLRRCLQKDPKRRLTAAADARLELDEAAAHVPEPVAAAPAPHVEARWSRLLPWVVGIAGALVGVTAFALWGPWRSSIPAAPIRLSSEIGATGPLSASIGGSVALSPDGRMLAMVVVNEQGRAQLHVRRTSELRSVPLAGTEDAYAPFFSPDGQSIAFFAGGSLKKVAVTGGATMTLCAAESGRGGAWDSDGTIVFQPSAAPAMVLHRVPHSGGTPVAFGKLAEGETSQRWPQILPGRRGVLYSGHVGTTGWDQGNIMVQPPDGGPSKLVWKGGFNARYVPTGHILYINQGNLFALPFDLDSLTAVGNPAPAVEDVLSTLNTGGAFYSVADDGTLVYVMGQAIDRQAPIHLLDASGKVALLRAAKAEWYFPRFSPSGHKLAMTIGIG